MNRITIIFILITFCIGSSSCNRKFIPGLKPGKVGNSYDSAAFNYVFVEGIKQKLMGNYGESLKYFEQCLIINPKSDASFFQMAQIVLGNGDLINGKTYLLKAYQIEPENVWYNLLLSGIYHQTNKIDSAIIYYEKAVRIDPSREELLLSLANLYTQNGNYKKANDILIKLDEKYGSDERTSISLVDNLIAEKKYDEALKKINILMEQKPDDIIFNGYLAEIYSKLGDKQSAKNVYEILISRNPENPGIQISLCKFLEQQKEYDELFRLLRIIIKNKKISKEEKVSLLAGLIENDKIKNANKNQMVEALSLMEEEYQDDDLVVLMKPEFLKNTGMLNDAVIQLEEIIKIKPENYFAWEKLLLLFYELKDFNNLQRKGEMCSTKFNRSVIAKMLYATGAMENKNFVIAEEELRKAEILAGDNKAILLQILTMKADLCYRKKDFVEAFRLFDQALKMKSDDLTVLNNYAYYLAEQGVNLREAERMAKIVVEKDKNNNTFLDTYAWVLFKLGKNREAAKIMENIILIKNVEDAEYLEHYGFILKRLNKFNMAVEMWKKAIYLDKNKSYLLNEIENCKE